LRRELGPLGSVILLALFIITASSLAASLRLIDVSSLAAGTSQQQPSAPTSQTPLQIVSEVEPGSSAWLVVAGVIAVAVLFVFLARKKQFHGSDGSLWRLIGVLFGAAIWLGLIQLLNSIQSFMTADAQQRLVLTSDIVSLAAIMAIASAMAAIAWLERSRTLHTSASLEGRTPIQGVHAFLDSVRRRIYSMPQGEVYRDSVIACYSTMTGLLASYGADDRPSFTPQELEARATRKLAFAETDIHLLTQLFEKARYADSVVTKSDAQDSADALERMANGAADKLSPVGAA